MAREHVTISEAALIQEKKKKLDVKFLRKFSAEGFQQGRTSVTSELLTYRRDGGKDRHNRRSISSTVMSLLAFVRPLA